MQIILARHGETELNVKQVFRGRVDVGLNETGRKEAELLAEYLGEFEIEAIYSSPLKRTMQTAEIIAARNNLEVRSSPGLMDFDYGEWQGLNYSDVQAKYREVCDLWANHPERAQIPGAETLSDVRKRAVGLVDEVVARHKGNVVLMTHRVVNKILICALLGLDNSHFWNVRQDTGAVSIFAYERNRFIFTRHNENCFLDSLNIPPAEDF